MMDDAARPAPLPDDPHQLKAIIAQRDATIAQREATIATLTTQRDEFYLKNLQLEVRLAKALKQVYGPRADRISDQAQMVLDFAGRWKRSRSRPKTSLRRRRLRRTSPHRPHRPIANPPVACAPAAAATSAR